MIVWAKARIVVCVYYQAWDKSPRLMKMNGGMVFVKMINPTPNDFWAKARIVVGVYYQAWDKSPRLMKMYGGMIFIKMINPTPNDCLG